jgi:hypothetical protein
LLEKVPYVALKGEWKTKDRNYPKGFKMPRYDLLAYQAAFTELNEMLANELNGHPDVEYVDTFMYGFWGEGNTWPFTSHPFPDDATAEKTWIKMLEMQLKCWTKTPLVTNTQPDWSCVGNSELVARTIRSNNWLRTDSIFIENEQIEALSNRPSWIAAISEAGMTTGDTKDLRMDQGVTTNENIIQHVIDGHRRQLLVGVELAQHFGAPHSELLRKISDTDRHPRPPHRDVPQADVSRCGKKQEGLTRSPRRRARAAQWQLEEWPVRDSLNGIYGISGRLRRSLRLDVGCPDHLAPFLGILDDVVAELGRRFGKRLLAQVDKARFHFRISEGGVNCLVEAFDNFGRRVLGRADANPAARLVAGYEFTQGGDAG